MRSRYAIPRLPKRHHKCPSCLAKGIYYTKATIAKLRWLTWVTVKCRSCHFAWQELHPKIKEP